MGLLDGQPSARYIADLVLSLLQRLSLDANMLRGSDGGSSSLSRGSNSNDYVMSVKYGADLQAQGSGDQLGPLPTQVMLYITRNTHQNLWWPEKYWL